MENMRIRRLIFDNGIRHKDVAAYIGICQETFSRKLAKKLSKEEESKILAIVNEIAKRNKDTA
ncbi:MAG: hypothetical protein RR449_01705 [Christensenella sp.]